MKLLPPSPTSTPDFPIRTCRNLQSSPRPLFAKFPLLEVEVFLRVQKMSTGASRQIASIHELEKKILEDQKHTNSILDIKLLFLEKHAPSVQMAAMHALRRVFVKLLDDGALQSGNGGPNDTSQMNKRRKDANSCCSSSSSSRDSSSSSAQKYAKWLQNQLIGYMDGLYAWVRSGNGEKQAPAIRTVMEFVKRESRLHSGKDRPNFGIKTYRRLLTHVLACPLTNDVELLVMIRDEIFEHPDCGYYALQVVKEAIHDFKEGADEAKLDKKRADAFIQNAFDLLRVMTVPSDPEEEEMFVAAADSDEAGEGDMGEAASDNDEASSSSDEEKDTLNRKGNKKRKGWHSGAKEKKKNEGILQKFCDPLAHRRIFSKAWLLLLSLPLTAAQHRLVLRHLPDHVIPEMVSPLLLADYLTQSYEMGGVLAVLSLESLFILIAQHNLDYPNFFLSLYKLCTVKVFSAKYRNKFMRLLQTSLQSTNLPAYVVGAFVKRLMGLAIQAPAPAAQFCIAQSIWLLRRHPQSQRLIHASNSKPSGTSGVKEKQEHDSSVREEFDAMEEEDLERAGALGSQSSLWEAALLEHHHYHAVASLAASLRKAGSTAPEALIGKPGLTEDEVPIPIHVPEFIEQSYASFMEAELDKVRKAHGAPLATRKPDGLKASIVSTCFGGF